MILNNILFCKVFKDKVNYKYDKLFLILGIYVSKLIIFPIDNILIVDIDKIQDMSRKSNYNH